MIWYDEMLWAIDKFTNVDFWVRNDIFFTWKLVLRYWKPRCGRSPTERLRWTLKALTESNLWRFKRVVTKPSLTGQEGVVDNREFLGNSGTTWSALRDLKSRSFLANNRRHQKIVWTPNDDDRSLENLNWRQPSTAVQAYAYASLLNCLLCHNKERLNV